MVAVHYQGEGQRGEPVVALHAHLLELGLRIPLAAVAPTRTDAVLSSPGRRISWYRRHLGGLYACRQDTGATWCLAAQEKIIPA